MTRILRIIALAICIAAIIDPAIPGTRRVKPVVAIVEGDSARDAALADRVEGALGGQFTIVRGTFDGAAASVIAGDRVPEHVRPKGPVFAVHDTRNGVTIERIHVPSTAPLHARVPVTVTTQVAGARGQDMSIELRANGAIVDRATRNIETDDDTIATTLEFAPTATGHLLLEVSSQVPSPTSHVSRARELLRVHDERLAVLFYAPRPSWMTTFVRRAIELDARFAVTSRTVTSRNASADAGDPPRSLDDLAALEVFDVVVVGAPESLMPREVDGLERFMRSRGGGVVFLLDERMPGAYERLTGVAQWDTVNSAELLEIDPAPSDSIGLRAREMAWPARMPAGAKVVAHSGARPVVWSSPVGAGRLVVSGALDSWRLRDAATSGFDSFWRNTIADAASGAPRLVDVELPKRILAPGERANIAVTVRDAALAPRNAGTTIRSSAEASIERTGVERDSAHAAQAVLLLPGADPGTFRGTFRAPLEPGEYRIAVSAGGGRASTVLHVADRASSPARGERDLLIQWTTARGGVAVPFDRIDSLRTALSETVRGEERRELTHPMRSPWWIVPFALALGGEWMLRRRRGLA